MPMFLPSQEGNSLKLSNPLVQEARIPWDLLWGRARCPCPGDGIAPPRGESRGWAQDEGVWSTRCGVSTPHPPLCEVKTSEPGEPAQCGNSTLLELFPKEKQ